MQLIDVDVEIGVNTYSPTIPFYPSEPTLWKAQRGTFRAHHLSWIATCMGCSKLTLTAVLGRGERIILCSHNLSAGVRQVNGAEAGGKVPKITQSGIPSH